MPRKLLVTIFVICNLASGSIDIYVAEPSAPQPGVKLSPELQNLLRAEMREIAAGVQGIAVSLATADWQAIQETSTKIRTSYIMEKSSLRPRQRSWSRRFPNDSSSLTQSFISARSAWAAWLSDVTGFGVGWGLRMLRDK